MIKKIFEIGKEMMPISLQQAMDVSTRFKKHPGLLVHPSKAHYPHYLVRVSDKLGGSIVWDKGERPYYPYMSLLIDHNSALFLNFQMGKHADYILKFPEKFADFIEHVKVMPDELLVKRHDVYRLFEPLSAELGIKIKMVESLPALEYAQRTMKGFL